MFKKILIANRGEIACRVIRTAKRMGIRTVAVYSDADANGLHVEMADEAVHIGGAAAAQSYLNMDAVIRACRQTGADAVHPGFGFLSENSNFVAALEAAGIAFIGPTREAIGAMGDKIESKKLAEKAGVSTVPGFLGEVSDPDHAVKIAHQVGFPVMIKASAGGGGKGMRIARSDKEVREGFTRATSEAKASFGDDRVFIERYVETPRHIEIQVLADAHGNIVYLGERECSIQRRHQKVIEEAPSPFLDAKTRKAMGEQAVALAKAVNYRSAGTVEFIVDPQRNFFFLEMNTRLQVEHPVTEMITGLDIVEWMIRVAAGEKLPFRQKDVKLTGWAMEARIYAEDPSRNFLPSIGRLVRYQPPAEKNGIRVDAGTYEGDEISRFYDPMIAKLVAYGDDRAEAIAKMQDALARFVVRGCGTNVNFLSAVMANPRFQAGDMSTAFIEETWPDGFDGIVMDPPARYTAVAVAASIHARKVLRSGVATANWTATLAGGDYAVGIDSDGDLTINGTRYVVESAWRPGTILWDGTVNGAAVVAQVDRAAEGVKLTLSGAEAHVMFRSPRTAELAKLMPVKQPPDMSKFLLSPMPGLVVSVAVHEGQDVEAGEALAVVDAMKMENVLTAERKSTVSKVHAKPGDSLAVDQVILEFK